MESPLFVLAPTAPGDLVASRTLLAALAARAEVRVAVRRALLPLIEDLARGAVTYDLPWPVDPDSEEFAEVLTGFELPAHRLVLDLLGMPSVMRWLQATRHASLGYRVQADEDVPYLRSALWHLRGDGVDVEDLTHFGVRLLRIIPGYDELRCWPPSLFDQARYPHQHTSSGRLALAPGCGRGGADKRMPSAFWRPLARRARSLGLLVVWFIGPDETELIGELVEPADEVISGGWDEVLASHAGCALGVTNDTCHMHLRAHLACPTLAFFRRPEVEPWGAYPSSVTCVAPPESLAVDRSIALAVEWLQRALAR